MCDGIIIKTFRYFNSLFLLLDSSGKEGIQRTFVEVEIWSPRVERCVHHYINIIGIYILCFEDLYDSKIVQTQYTLYY